jgi:hypothetical protein
VGGLADVIQAKGQKKTDSVFFGNRVGLFLAQGLLGFATPAGSFAIRLASQTATPVRPLGLAWEQGL